MSEGTRPSYEILVVMMGQLKYRLLGDADADQDACMERIAELEAEAEKKQRSIDYLLDEAHKRDEEVERANASARDAANEVGQLNALVERLRGLLQDARDCTEQGQLWDFINGYEVRDAVEPTEAGEGQDG